MIKASDSDTVLDEKNVSPIKAEHSESINCVSKQANSETKVTETSRSSNRSRKIPGTRSNDFFVGKLLKILMYRIVNQVLKILTCQIVNHLFYHNL